jgi:hypothetical protein
MLDFEDVVGVIPHSGWGILVVVANIIRTRHRHRHHWDSMGSAFVCLAKQGWLLQA